MPYLGWASVFFLSFLLFLLNSVDSVSALEIRRIDLYESGSLKHNPDYKNKVFVDLRGKIQAGDANRLDEFFNTRGRPGNLKSSDVVFGLNLNSSGGDFAETLVLSNRFAGAAELKVTVKEKCSAECFILFAAAKHRFAAEGAKIGILLHSPGDSASHAAHIFRKYQVPAAIVGKASTKKYGEIYWLSDDDLKQMKVTRFINKPEDRW
jgi:hypothetical protein